MTHRLFPLLLGCARGLLGATLMVSGLTKAIDPAGTLYKLQEYAAAIGWGSALSATLLTIAAIALAATEWMLGLSLLLGTRRRLTTTLTMALMALMTLVALWLTIANPVSDCGCFGDAVRLSNTQTLLKNVLLLAASLLLWRRADSITPHPSPFARRIATHLSLLYVLAIAAWGLYRLPLVDFRPYHAGVNIPQAMQIPEGETPPKFETTFILQKDGEQREFTLDNYPDSTWTFVDSRTRQVEEGYTPPIHDLSFTLADTQEDITQQVLTHSGNTVLLVIRDLATAPQTHYGELNALYEAAQHRHMPFYALTAGTPQQIAQWRKTTAAAYPFAFTDATTLKTMLRSNLGVVLLRQGTVLAKWSNNNLPQPSDLKATHPTQPTPQRQLAMLILPYLLAMLLLLALPYIRKHQKQHTS